MGIHFYSINFCIKHVLVVDIHILQTTLCSYCASCTSPRAFYQNKTSWQPFWDNVTLLRCDNVEVLHYLPIIWLFTTLWQRLWQSTDFRCCNIISQRFCNDIATLSQRSHNVELLAGWSWFEWKALGHGHCNPHYSNMRGNIIDLENITTQHWSLYSNVDPQSHNSSIPIC